MSMTVQIELSDDDLIYFKETLEKAKTTDALATQEAIVNGAEKLLDSIEATNKLPDFVKAQFKQFHVLIHMLTNKEWNLPEREKSKVMNMIAYFTNSYHLIPDDIPGIGYLDEAILVDLVVKDVFKEYKNFHEYEHYCEMENKVHHKHQIKRSDWEKHNQVSMYQRMRNRQAIGNSFNSGSSIDVF